MPTIATICPICRSSDTVFDEGTEVESAIPGCSTWHCNECEENFDIEESTTISYKYCGAGLGLALRIECHDDVPGRGVATLRPETIKKLISVLEKGLSR
jgi:hypothetical protein